MRGFAISSLIPLRIVFATSLFDVLLVMIDGYTLIHLRMVNLAHAPMLLGTRRMNLGATLTTGLGMTANNTDLERGRLTVAGWSLTVLNREAIESRIHPIFRTACSDLWRNECATSFTDIVPNKLHSQLLNPGNGTRLAM